jgi:hypothetical protein
VPLSLGLLETFFFVRHVTREGVTAGDVDQAVEYRARSEVSVAHLALAVLGLLFIWLRGRFWFATIVGQAVLLSGVAAPHGREALKNEMHSEAAPLGWQYFILGSSESACTAFPLFLETYATRLLAQALIRRPNVAGAR